MSNNVYQLSRIGGFGTREHLDEGVLVVNVVNPTAGLASGTVALSLVAGGATDAAGNVALAANLAGLDSQAINTLAPTVVAVTDNVAAPVANGPISFTATFSEAVTGFTGSDISFAGSALPSWKCTKKLRPARTVAEAAGNGMPRAQPIVESMSEIARQHGLTAEGLATLIDAREEEIQRRLSLLSEPAARF